jgi:glycosyltransferase involved in cell wall biosynthesis
MNVLHLSTSDIDGGAARAAYRLHQGLREQGTNSRLLVRAKASLDSDVLVDKSGLTKLGPPLNSVPLKRYRHRTRAMFSPQWFPDAIAPKVQQFNPDIVHLHWVCNGFLRIETLAKLNKPLVWTVHDMWPLTGGCHYTYDCDRYQKSCGKCPQLMSQRERDLSRQVWQRKVKAWRALDLTLVAPSQWVADCARASSLFQTTRVEIIPHGLDLSQFRPIEKALARDLLRLPNDRQIVLFGASSGVMDDPRKGFQFLQAALQQLSSSEWRNRLMIAIFGISEPQPPLDLGIPSHYLGRLSDDLTLALAYSSADVMVVPSMQETFGQTASESLACGTPVVAFQATGLQDVVAHQKDGYLAQPFRVEDLVQGIRWVLENSERHQNLQVAAYEKARKEFSLELQAHRHISLYKCILQKSYPKIL